MNKQTQICYFHSVYPELFINCNKIKGYSIDEIKKIEKLYDVEIKGQLYDFLISLGRCSGGLFSDNALIFYRENMGVRSHIFFQYSFCEELFNLQYYDFLKEKPFVFSFENETQYFFTLTKNDNNDLVYHYDENQETVISTGLNFNEHLRNLVNTDTRMFIKDITDDLVGELIVIK